MTFPPSPAKIAARMSAPDTREIILEARELTREFDGVKALDRFSFKLHRGEVLGLLGANGAGKTTAMNCLLGLTATATKVKGKRICCVYIYFWGKGRRSGGLIK